MRSFILIIYSILYIGNVGFSQCYWAKRFGGSGTSMEVGYSVKTDQAGNIYVAGTFQGTVDFNPDIGTNNLTSVGQIDIFICKYDSNGNFIWAKSFGSTVNDYCKAIFVDFQGNVYATGYFQSTTDFDPGTGTFTLSSSGSSDIFITKLDSNGNFIWAKKMGGTGFDSGYSITIDGNNNILITGTFSGTVDFDPGTSIINLISSGTQDIFISKYDNNGNYLWARKIGGSSNDLGNSIVTDANFNVYTTGSFAGIADFDPGVGTFNITSAGSQSVYVNKLDPSGNFVWAKSMGGAGSGANQGNGIALDALSNIFLTGYFSSTIDIDPNSGVYNLTSIGSQDAFNCKLDNGGNLIWATQIGGTSLDMGNAIVIDNSSNIYTTGYFGNSVDFDPSAGVYNLTSQGVQDTYTYKSDSNGNLIWAKKMGGTGNDQGNSICLDALSNIISTGNFSNSVDFNPDLGTFNLTSAGNIDVYLHKINQSYQKPLVSSNGPLNFCVGNSVSLSSSYASSNIWSTGATTQSITTSSSGVFYVSTFDNVCYSSSDSVVVTVNPLPASPVISAGGPTAICQGNTVTLTSSAAASYLWNTGAITQSISVNSAGSYSVKVFNASGCSSTSNSISVIVQPTPTVSTNNTGPYCPGNSISLTALGGGTYSWSGPGGFTSTSQNPIITNATTSMSGTYSVTVTSNGCSSTATTMVTVNSNPSTPTVSVSGPLTFCQGGSVTLTSSSATGYTWSTGATSQSITVSSSGTYSVIVLNASGCTAASNSITVTVNPNSATPTITANGPLTFCEGDSVVLSSNFPENSLHDNNWFNGTTSVGNNSSITITTSGTYYVSHYYTPGTTLYCPAYSSTVTVTVLPRPNTPTITVNGPLIICTGSPVMLNSSSNINNIWSNGATSPSITVYNSGSYYLQITDGVCTSLSSIPVTITTVNPPINPSITVNGSLTLCKGEMVQLISNQTSNVIWSNGETTPYIDVYEPGSYLVSVSNGVCPTLTSNPVLISVNNLDVIISTSNQLAENSPNTSITFNANATNVGTTPTYEWYKNGLPVGSNSATYTNNNWVNGEKIVCRVTSSSGCSVYSNDLFVWLAQTTSDSWQRMADVGLDKNMVTPLFPTRIGAVSFTIGDKIYVGLGYDDKKGLPSVPNAGYLSDFWEYNTITDEWTERAPFAFGNSPRMDAIAFVVNGRGYVGCGVGNGLYNDLWEYNPQTDSWTQKSNCPGMGRHSAVATNIGMSGYVGTGWGVNTYLNDWWKYTPATNTWTQLANYPFSYFGLNCASVNNRIYVSGTSSALTNAVSINYEYNPDNNTWAQKSSMPGNRYYSESFVINDTIFHCGGQSNPFTCQSAVTYDEVWAYYPPNDSWIQKSNVHFGKISNGCAASVNGYGYYISGGYNPVCQASSGWNYDGYGRETNLKYSPQTDSWEVKAVHGGLKKYFGFSTTIGDKGFALFQYSGLTGNTITNMDIFEVYLYEYDPLNNTWKQKSKYPGQGIFQAGNGFSLNGKIYYGSGASSNNVFVSDFWEYNPINDTWTLIGNIPIATNRGYNFVLNSKGYVGGGQMGNSFFEFNPTSYSWTPKASIPASPSGNINFSLNNMGYTSTYITATTGSLYKYDPSINIWSLVNNLPNFTAGISNFYFSFQTSSKGFYGTGINSTTTPQTTSLIYEFNPLNNSWVQKQTLSENHSTGGTFSFPNNSYVFSGNQYYPPHTAAINSMWQYKSDYSNITSTFKESNLYRQRFNIFPNPTTSIINVEKTEDIGISEISIYDFLGRKLSTMIPENNSVVQIEMPLMPGTYYLKIEDENGKRDFFKVLKI